MHLNLAHPVAASQASHALAVDNGGARLIVFRLGDPHLLKGAEGSQDGATDPDAVLPLRWSDHLDPHRGWCQRAEFLGHALTDAREHGGATREHHVAEEITANVHVALLLVIAVFNSLSKSMAT